MTWTGILHGIYGLGAFASPLVATSMVTKGIPVRSSYEHAGTDSQASFFIQYHLFYTTNIGLNVVALVLVRLAFHGLQSLPLQTSEDAGGHAPVSTPSSGLVFRQTLRNRAMWTLAIFLMLYVG